MLVIALPIGQRLCMHELVCRRGARLGDLRDGATGRSTALGRLLNVLPAWISATARAEAGFRRALTAIAKTAIEGTDIQLGDAADVAGCVADKLKLIDLPRIMESFGGTSQDARSRALLKEIKAVATPAARQELLRERFIDVVRAFGLWWVSAESACAI